MHNAGALIGLFLTSEAAINEGVGLSQGLVLHEQSLLALHRHIQSCSQALCPDVNRLCVMLCMLSLAQPGWGSSALSVFVPL